LEHDYVNVRKKSPLSKSRISVYEIKILKYVLYFPRICGDQILRRRIFQQSTVNMLTIQVLENETWHLKANNGYVIGSINRALCAKLVVLFVIIYDAFFIGYL